MTRRSAIACCALMCCAALVGCTSAGAQGRADGEKPPAASGVKQTAGFESSADATKPAASESIGDPKVAAMGSVLEPLPVAPPKTHALFDLPSPFKGAELEFVAEPYGWAGGPKDVPERGVLLKVESAKPTSGQAEDLADLTGKNALVWLDAATQGREGFSVGGTYRIRVRVRPDGKTGTLRAVSVERYE